MEAFIKFGTAVVAVIALTFGVVAYNKQVEPASPDSSKQAYGSVTGPDVYIHQFFHDNQTLGGLDFATTSQGSVTYTATSIANSRVIEHNAAGATTATLPTNAQLSAAGFLPQVGDTQTVFIHASTTKITLVGSTGVTLAAASTSAVISAGNVGRLECTRLGATEARLIQCLLTSD